MVETAPIAKNIQNPNAPLTQTVLSRTRQRRAGTKHQQEAQPSPAAPCLASQTQGIHQIRTNTQLFLL